MRLEEALLKKQVPKWNSKRYRLLEQAASHLPKAVKCEICKKMLLNPQSILIHQGGHCRGKLNK